MPLVAIPFQLPPAFPLPPHWLDHLGADAQDGVTERVIELLEQLDAADLIWFSKRLGDQWTTWDHWGRALLAGDVAARVSRDFTQSGWDPRIWNDAMRQGHPMLVMGDGIAAGPLELPKALAEVVGAKAPLGFLYVFPIVDASQQVVAQMSLYRLMANGPLNHDQPAIVQSLLQLITQCLPQTAGQ